MKPTVTTLQEQVGNGQKIVMLTCYDSSMSKIVDKANVDIILVGDSLGNTMLGYENTLSVTMSDMIAHTRAVTRVVKNTFVLADLPFMSYHNSVADAVENAGRLVKEGHAEAVKLEGGAEFVEVISAITRAQIPVCAHLGLTPQSYNAHGGYKVQAKTDETAKKLLNDALAVQKAGAFMLVLEGIPREVAKTVTNALDIPVIGIGAGPDTSGQVLVLQDMLGINENVPKFVKKYANFSAEMLEAFNNYANDVQNSTFPDDVHSFHKTLVKEGLKEV